MRRWEIVFALGLVGAVVGAGGSAAGERAQVAPKPAREPRGVTSEAPPNALVDIEGFVGDREAIQHAMNVCLAKAPQPSDAVWSLIEGFRSRSPEAYVAMMSDDYRFDSDDPAFTAAYPNGMTRSDEESFARHLFQGGARAPDGSLLPTAAQVLLPSCVVLTGGVSSGGDTAHAVLDHFVVRVVLTSGDTLAVGVSRSQLDLIPTPNGWRVCRWREWLRTPLAEEAMKRRMASAEAPVPAGAHPARVDVAPASAHGVARGAMALPEGFDTPTRLELVGEPDAGYSAFVFDLTMPRPGGLLEVFDVMGRRVALRDLSDLGAGRHRIGMDAASLGAGVYFARVRQEAGVATARIVWAR